jgi:hypothetical protein
MRQKSESKTLMQKMEQIVDDYRRRGYEITIEPKPHQLPGSLKNYPIDIIARSPKETVLIEMKSWQELRKGNQLANLASAVQRRPGWRLELVAVGAREQRKQIRRLSKEDLSRRLEESARLRKMGYCEASFLLDWSVVEAALRDIAAEHDIDVTNRSALFAVKKLFSLGILNKGEYELLERELQRRNFVAHGNEASITTKEGERFALMTRKILEMDHISAPFERRSRKCGSQTNQLRRTSGHLELQE